LEGVKDYYMTLEAPAKHLVVIEGGNHVQYMDQEMAEVPVRLGIDKKPEALTEEVHKQCEAGLLYWFDRHLR
jgi:hypothetical protein